MSILKKSSLRELIHRSEKTIHRLAILSEFIHSVVKTRYELHVGFTEDQVIINDIFVPIRPVLAMYDDKAMRYPHIVGSIFSGQKILYAHFQNLFKANEWVYTESEPSRSMQTRVQKFGSDMIRKKVKKFAVLEYIPFLPIVNASSITQYVFQDFYICGRDRVIVCSNGHGGDRERRDASR
jgi:prepilin signal peptidase PulO-like enzyme (type II secretory pathway)